MLLESFCSEEIKRERTARGGGAALNTSVFRNLLTAPSISRLSRLRLRLLLVVWNPIPVKRHCLEIRCSVRELVLVPPRLGQDGKVLR